MPSIRTSANGSTATAPTPATTPAAGPPRLLALPRRRRPAFVALAVALLAGGGGLGAAMIAAIDSRTPVLAIARPVPPGAVLTSADLTRARVAADPALNPVPAGELSSVVGRRAAVPLRPGTLLTRDGITTEMAPAAGQQLLGVALKPGQLPARGAGPGARVLLVTTPGGGDPAGGRSGTPVAEVRIPATVHAVTTPAGGGAVIVDLLVGDRDATAAAQAASTGNIALLVQPAGSGG